MNAAPKIPSIYTVVALTNGFGIERNGGPLKTPAGADLILPTQILAESIAAEWRAQGDKIVHTSMPFMQFAATAIDIIHKDREAIVTQIAAYASSDLLCHYAEQPENLVKLQQTTWQPILDWCARHLGAQLRTGTGIMPIAQTPEALQTLHKAVTVYDDFHLTGLRQVVDIGGSLVLGLALMHGHLTAAQIFTAAELDTTFQIENWGEDPAALQRRKGIQQDLKTSQHWLEKLA